jgi:hypothetical protein
VLKPGRRAPSFRSRASFPSFFSPFTCLSLSLFLSLSLGLGDSVSPPDSLWLNDSWYVTWSSVALLKGMALAASLLLAVQRPLQASYWHYCKTPIHPMPLSFSLFPWPTSRLETICHFTTTIHHQAHFCVFPEVRASGLSQVVSWDRLLSFSLPQESPPGDWFRDAGSLPRRLSSQHYQNQMMPWQRLLSWSSLHYTPIIGSGKKLHCLCIQIWPQYSLDN